MSSQTSTEVPSIGETLGALYIGATIAAILYGVTNLQGVIYYRRYPNDWWVYRYSVGLLWVLDTVHVALSTYTVYFYLIHFFRDLNGALEYNSWSMKWQLALNDFLAVYIQGLYALRLWQLGRHFHKSITYFVPLAVVASLGTAIYLVYDTLKTPTYIFFSTIAVTDTIIAISMIYYLHKSRAIILVPSYCASPPHATCSHVRISYKCMLTSHSHFYQLSLRLINLLLRISRTSSILCGHSLWLSSGFISSSLSVVYINSLLAMLNSRSKHRSTSQTTEEEVVSLPAVLRITPLSSEGDVSETNISIPIQDIGSFSNQLDPSKEELDCRV
ncbi:hypothetical protein EV421DRAFT_1908464 [Armillaria borealis]|uniref:Uncharacterized protein n=1 Tax=Armillaria borealis TaxID=47425 RepID=A0AA39J438_9AGAR|nr:hypothetical protein EV421DRAFT_1908464 [Armillaria borealis]